MKGDSSGTNVLMGKPIIEALFGSGTQSKVMTFLYLRLQGSEPLAARELARAAGVPYGSISKTLQELTNDQLVVREETSRGPQYRAPYEDPRLKGLFLLTRQDSTVTQQLKRAFRGAQGVTYAGVCGSFASGQTHRESAIDVVVLGYAELDRFSLMAKLAKVAQSTGRDISPMFYSMEEFQGLVDRHDPVALSILANARIDLVGAFRWQS